MTTDTFNSADLDQSDQEITQNYDKKPLKPSVVEDIIDSIMEPGVNMRVFGMIQYVFALLQITLLVLLYLSSFSLHVLLLNISSTGLWVTLNWL